MRAYQKRDIDDIKTLGQAYKKRERQMGWKVVCVNRDRDSEDKTNFTTL